MAKSIIGTDPDQLPTNADLGSMAFQDKDSAKLDGGSINNTPIGATTPSTGTFTTLTSTGLSTHSGTSLLSGTGYPLGVNALGVRTDASGNTELWACGPDGATPGVLRVICTPSDGSPATNTISVSSTGLTTTGLTATAGITFPATQVASSDPNTLDDYEEGTFTPTLSSTGATFSYASQVGTYTKVGRVVYFQARVGLNTSGNTFTTNGTALVGLPFTASATTNANHPLSSVLNGLAASGNFSVPCQIVAGNNYITLYIATGTTINVLPSNYFSATAGASITIAGFYII